MKGWTDVQCWKCKRDYHTNDKIIVHPYICRPCRDLSGFK